MVNPSSPDPHRPACQVVGSDVSAMSEMSVVSDDVSGVSGLVTAKQATQQQLLAVDTGKSCYANAEKHQHLAQSGAPPPHNKNGKTPTGSGALILLEETTDT